MPKKIEISHKTIIFTVLFLIFLWFVLQIAEIISWVFIAFILMAAFKPIVDFSEKLRIPRALAIIFVYIFFISLVVFAFSTIIPPLVAQTVLLSEKFPELLERILPFITIDQQLFTQQIAPLSQNLLKVSVGIFNNMIALFTIMVITFYLLLERRNLNSYLTFLLGESSGQNVIAVIKKIEERLGVWVRGQITLLFTIGILTYIGLTLLNIPFALPLAILAGILEIIPTIGPILSAIPAVLVSFAVSPFHPLFTTVLYFIIQQLENQVVVPYVMSRVVGLPPLITILAILVGVKLAGIGGAILAVPIVVTIEAVLTAYFKLKEE